MDGDVDYEHTQVGWVHWVLIAFAVVLGVIQWLTHPERPIDLVCLLGATIFVGLAGAFATLTVRVDREGVVVRYGPLPIFRKRFAIASITHVEVGRSSVIDGLGIHFVPGRGWTYNLSGLECVVLLVDGKTVRIGTDDSERLAAVLHARTGR